MFSTSTAKPGPRPDGRRHRLPDCASAPFRGLTGAVFALGLMLAAPSRAAAPDRVDFATQIRPLLSDRCFKCHGPDESARKGKLRLDRAADALAVRDAKKGTRAIVPGHPETSEAWRRLVTTDADDLMPPAASKLTLNAQEKELIRRWIAQGADYPAHWSFVPVGNVSVPGGAPAAGTNAIDAFVAERLQREGLVLSPAASREVLIRRLSLDLTGLPPTLAEVDRFVQDPAPDAYARLVERLLAAPAYGERRANEWLDLARYADTYGYQADVERDLSPWRDWVIRAFNANLPFDQFVTWQIAGDLLPDATRDQVIATAFNRLHRQTNEGGSIEEEFRNEYVADRVHTFGTTFLGLTLECARCHDHKYDPLTQRDYYRFAAFFNNIDESGLYSHFTQAVPTPGLLLYPDGGEAVHAAARRAVTEREADLARTARSAGERFAAWQTGAAGKLTPPPPAMRYALDEVRENQTPGVGRTNVMAPLVDAPALVPGHQGQALQFSGDNMVVCKGAGAFDRTTPFSLNLWLKPAEQQDRAVVLHRSRAWTDSGSRGFELVLEQGRPSFSLIHFWPGNALKVRARDALPTNAWTLVTVTYDGSSRANGLALYVNGELAPLETIRDHLYKDILHRQAWGDADVGGIELTLAGRFRDSGFRGGAIDELEVYDLRLSALEVRALAGKPLPDATDAQWRAHYVMRVDPACRDAETALQQARQQENAEINDVREIMVMREMPGRRPTFVLKRGAYDAPGEPVEPGVPATLLPFSPEWPTNRLGLARWLVDRRQPLTARVAVNRAWRTHFGRGLVVTAEDFGSQGQVPAQPELLDWLAGWFMDHGWNVKELHRLIVTSATYRQTSQADAALRSRDPENLLLARGPKHRLPAELIRDSALSISGLLNPAIGGPSVKPYQPDGLWEESGTGKTYTMDHGDKLYRRSLYTFWRRTAPPPSMLTFDATTREVCTAKRESTTTPLQALVLLNDPQFIEAARVLAERLVRENADNLDTRITVAFRLASGRPPGERERAVLRQLYTEQQARFARDPEAAARLLAVGEKPVDKALPADQVAATTLLASAVMNLDEFVMKR